MVNRRVEIVSLTRKDITPALPRALSRALMTVNGVVRVNQGAFDGRYARLQILLDRRAAWSLPEVLNGWKNRDGRKLKLLRVYPGSLILGVE